MSVPRTGMAVGCVSVVVPVFNERDTICEVLRRLRSVPFATQIIVVDDGSRDGTTELLRAEAAIGTLDLVVHPENRGKGAAVRSGLERARGDLVIVQDADLEYDPADYPLLLRPIQEGTASVVYGSRFHNVHGDMYWWHYLGNRLLTLTCNLLYRTSLSDMETGYKVLPTEVARSLRLRSERWGFDPEVTAKVLKRGYRIHEVPISYVARPFHEGKKIRWKDGLTVAATLFRYRIFD